MPRSWMLSIASGFLSNSFLGEIPDLLGLQPLHGCGNVGSICQSPCSRHRCARRQHEVIEDVTARAVNITWQPSVYEVSTAPIVILLNFHDDACNSIQITAKKLNESDVKELENKVKAKISVQQDQCFGIYNVFLLKKLTYN